MVGMSGVGPADRSEQIRDVVEVLQLKTRVVSVANGVQKRDEIVHSVAEDVMRHARMSWDFNSIDLVLNNFRDASIYISLLDEVNVDSLVFDGIGVALLSMWTPVVTDTKFCEERECLDGQCLELVQLEVAHDRIIMLAQRVH